MPKILVLKFTILFIKIPKLPNQPIVPRFHKLHHKPSEHTLPIGYLKLAWHSPVLVIHGLNPVWYYQRGGMTRGLMLVCSLYEAMYKRGIGVR